MSFKIGNYNKSNENPYTQNQWIVIQWRAQWRRFFSQMRLLLKLLLPLFILFTIYKSVIIIKYPTTKVPNHIHYIFGMSSDFGGKPFSLIHYLAIKSAWIHLKPDQIHLYYAYEPSGIWFDQVKSINIVSLHKVEPIQEIFGKPLTHTAHQADILRLRLLIDKGGIYMDTDVIVLQPFPIEWYNMDYLMGQEGSFGLGNAVMMSKPRAKFPHRWLSAYKDHFQSGEWSETSIHLPKQLWIENPEELYVVGQKRFYYPLWTEQGIKTVYQENNYTFTLDQYTYHAWSQLSFDKYLRNLSIQDIQRQDSSIKRVLFPLLI